MKSWRSDNIYLSNNKATPVPPNRVAFWRNYWITLRPYLFFVSGAAGLLGLALAPAVEWNVLLVGFTAFFFSYGLGQAVTDTFQIDTDSISAPYRPLVRNEISAFHVLALSLAGLGLCTFVFAWLNPWTLLLCALGVVGLITYTWFKRRWWAGPFWNSWIVALLPAIGFLLGGASRSEALNSPLLGASMIVTFFSYAVFVLLGYFKDISADRKTGYQTLPVVAGWSISVWVSASYALTAVCFGFWILIQVGFLESNKVMATATYGGGLFWLSGVILLYMAHHLMLRLHNKEEEAFWSIGLAVRGFVLTHLGLAVVIRPDLFLFASIIYGLFEWTLHGRPDDKQI